MGIPFPLWNPDFRRFGGGVTGGVEKGLANLLQRKKITKITHPGHGQQTKWKCQINMKTRVVSAIVTLVLTFCLSAVGQSTAFTYQGQLNNPLLVKSDFTFKLVSDAAGSNVVASVNESNVPVIAGSYAVQLDFGNVFNGHPLWLEAIPKGGLKKSATIQLLQTPSALFANSASNLLGGLPASNLTGTIANNQLANSTITINAGTGLSGGGTVALGGLVTLNVNAASANTANTVVQRDSFGNFSANSLTLGGGLNLPDPAAIFSGNNILLYSHSAATSIFLGLNAGNPNRDGGFFNTAIGSGALQNNVNGDYNTADGALALNSNTSGGQNTAIGHTALYSNTSGSFNTANGTWALSANTDGNSNTANGWQALQNNTSGSFNTADGANALGQVETGSGNIALGFGAGGNLITGNNNIDIGNHGVDGDDGIIRIGDTQTATYLAGDVYGNSFNATSDRNAKENFVAVNPQQVLEKVAALPVTKWNYIMEQNTVHIGPVAQDFQAAFGLNGKDDKHISLVDEGGVALAAIQGLNQKLNEKDVEIQRQSSEILLLKQSVIELKAIVSQLSQNQIGVGK